MPFSLTLPTLCRGLRLHAVAGHWSQRVSLVCKGQTVNAVGCVATWSALWLSCWKAASGCLCNGGCRCVPIKLLTKQVGGLELGCQLSLSDARSSPTLLGTPRVLLFDVKPPQQCGATGPHAACPAHGMPSRPAHGMPRQRPPPHCSLMGKDGERGEFDELPCFFPGAAVHSLSLIRQF